MDSLPVIIILACAGSMFVIALITSLILYRYMVEPKPKRDITINSNIWPLTLPSNCFNETGQQVRRLALSMVVVIMAITIITLMYIGIVLWLN